MDTDEMTRDRLAAMIDHAVLRPDTTDAELRTGCEVAARCKVASICVRPCDVADASRLLEGIGVPVGTVIGFPHGSTRTAIKAAEAARAIADGAEELDMVINIGAIRSGRSESVRQEIAAVVTAAAGRIVKVIFECGLLSREQMAAACQAAEAGGARFVKTCTGFGPSGAKAEDVRFLREQVGDRLGVKAAGGIRTLPDALAMIRAGASRIGTSSTEQILAELPA